MNPERFDNLTRILASGEISRRGALKAILTGAAGAILSSPLTGKSMSSASAATLQAVSCTNSNTFEGTCQEYKDYASACGPYLAQTGEHCGGMTGTSIYGCTVPLFTQEFKPYPKTLKCKQISKDLYRCQEDYRFVVSLLSMPSAALIFVPDGSECCVGKCRAEADAFNTDTIQHEAEHASYIQAAVTAMNSEFAKVTVFGEGSKTKTAQTQLAANVANKASELSDLFDTRIEFEPSDRPLGCSECTPPSSPCHICDNGTCVLPPNAEPCGDACCGSCQICDNGTCRTCNACETCDNGTCVSSCSACETCRDGTCVNKCACTSLPCTTPRDSVCVGGACVCPQGWVSCSREDWGSYCCPAGDPQNPQSSCSKFTPGGCQ